MRRRDAPRIPGVGASQQLGERPAFGVYLPVGHRCGPHRRVVVQAKQRRAVEDGVHCELAAHGS